MKINNVDECTVCNTKKVNHFIIWNGHCKSLSLSVYDKIYFMSYCNVCIMRVKINSEAIIFISDNKNDITKYFSLLEN